MADVPKFLDSMYPVEITRRVNEGQLLLSPSPELNSQLAGIVGHFARAYDIVLFAYAFASNHYHILGFAPSQKAASMFERGVNQCITMRLKDRFAHLGWKERHISIWEGTFEQVQMLDDATLVKRFRYIVSHGCKEHLVAHPHEWPGLTSAHQIQTGMADRGIWFDQTGYGKAVRAGKDVRTEDFIEHHELRCVPLPSLCQDDGTALDWSGRSGPELLDEIACFYAEERAREGLGPVKGRYAVMAESPFKKLPKALEPVPLCMTADPEKEKEYRAARRAYINCYYGIKGALMRQKDGRSLTEIMALFPEGSCIGHAGWRPMAA